MTKRGQKKKFDYKPYPKEDALRSGCKVGWHYYWDLKDAKKASEAAKHNAQIQQALGYDFGYCSPGSVHKLDKDWKRDRLEPGREIKAGMYEVCIP